MKKNISKYRGSRTCGGGTHKNRRGGGSRGGRGKAGGCKHHFVRNYMNGLAYGKHGFKRPQKVVRLKSIEMVNVGELDELAEELVLYGDARKEGDVYHINLAELECPIDKVLGNGSVNNPMVVTVSKWSAIAQSKIEEAGGRIEEYIPTGIEESIQPEEPLEPQEQDVE